MSEQRRGSDSVYFTNLLKLWDLESDGIDRKTLLEAGGLSLLQSNTPLSIARSCRYRRDRITGMPQSTTLQPVTSKYRTDNTPDTLQSNTLRPVASYKADETSGTQLTALKSAAKAASGTGVCTDVLNSTFESLSDFDLFGTSSDNDSIHTPQSPGLSHCCPSCDYHNSYGANWCMECGTALTGSKQPWSSEDKSQAGSMQPHTPHGVTHNRVGRQTTSTIGVADSGLRSTLALSPERGLTKSRPACNTDGMTDSSIGVTIASFPDRRNHIVSTQACNMIHGSSNLRQPFTQSETIDNHNAAMSVPTLAEIHHYERNAVHPSRRSCNNLQPFYSDLSQLLLHSGNLRYSRSTVPSDRSGRESPAAESICRLQQQHSQRNPHCDNASHYRRLPNIDDQKQHVTDSPLQEECRVADKHLTTEMGSHAVMCHSEHTLLLNETPSLSLLTGQVSACKISPAASFSKGSDGAYVSSEDENVQRSSDSHYVRHWDTSSVYMWRKPSTLASRKPRTLKVSALLHPQHLAENLTQQPVAETVTTDVLPKGDTASYGCHPNHGAPCKRAINTSCTATIGKCKVNVPPLDVGKMEEDQSTLKPLVTESGPTFLLTLPDELLLAVFSFLTQTDLVACMLVCWRMHIVASDPSLWRKITLWKQYTLTDDTLLNVVGKHPQTIAFHHCKGTISARTLQAAFQRLSAHVKMLSIDTCDFGSYTGDMLLTSAALHCPKLCSIEVKWTQLSERAFIYCIQHCSRLEEVFLEQTPNITLQSIKRLLESHGKWLKVLMLKGLSTTFGMAVVTLCAKQQVATLTSFAATFTQVEQHTMQQLTAAFPNLRRLEIHCTSISEEASFLLSQLPLESLVLMPLAPLTATSLAHISNMHTLSSVKYPI